MKQKIKLLILAFLLVLSGCNSKSNIYEKENYNAPNKDNKVVKHIENMLKANYDYEHIAFTLEGKLVYKGTYYDNITKGTKYSSFTNDVINYQLEDSGCFDPETKESIFNVFWEGESSYLNLSELKNNIKNSTCNIKANNAICNDGNITYNIILNKDYISKIIIDISKVSLSFVKYELNYTNINNTNVIKKLYPFVFIEFSAIDSNNLLKEISKNIFTYNLNNIKLIYMNEETKINIKNINKIIQYADNKKEYIDNIMKYTFKDYVIFIKYSDQNKIEKIILGKINNSNEILKVLLNII